MSKKKWNDLAKTHAADPVFSGGPISSRPPMKFDKAGLVLPAPYSFLQKWLSKHLAGDWPATKEKGAIAVRITDPQDAALLTQRFSAIGKPNKTVLSPHTQQILYADADYAALAADLGYKL